MNTNSTTNYKTGDFAALIGVSVKTLQRWDRDNILKAKRSPTNRRYYTYDQYLEFKGIKKDEDTRQTVSVKTLQRWDRDNILKAKRSPTNRRYYTYDQYLEFKGIKKDEDTRQTVIYARVSTRNQKDDLTNQVEVLKQYCNSKGMIVDNCIQDYGSGLNYNREKWNKLLNDVMDNKVKTIVKIIVYRIMEVG